MDERDGGLRRWLVTAILAGACGCAEPVGDMHVVRPQATAAGSVGLTGSFAGNLADKTLVILVSGPRNYTWRGTLPAEGWNLRLTDLPSGSARIRGILYDRAGQPVAGGETTVSVDQGHLPKVDLALAPPPIDPALLAAVGATLPPFPEP